MPAALDEAIPSLQARHEKQGLLFFAELLVRSHCWNCQKAVRVEADVLGILWRIRSGGSRSTLAVSTEENLGREDNTSSK